MAPKSAEKFAYYRLHDGEQSIEEALSDESGRELRHVERCRFVKILCVCAILGIALVFMWSAVVPRNGSSHRRRTLRFTGDGTFRITVFADLHFGENAWDSWGPQQDLSTAKIMGDILDAESQELVVLNGDLITGENTYAHNSSKYVDQIVAPIVNRDLPFASTYGNHDSAFNLSREQILAREHRFPGSLTEQMVFGRQAGVSNYYLEVFPYNNNKVPSLLLWFFDSRGGHYYQEKTPDDNLVAQPNWVDRSVVEFFTTTTNHLNHKHGKIIPSLAFVHIPTNASAALQSEDGVHPHRQPGINDDYILAPQSQGWCPHDGTAKSSVCTYGGQDAPFMRALVSTPGLMAVFSGHNHGDTWCYQWNHLVPGMEIAGNGIHLCFNQHSGYGGYGSWERGSRQILVREEDLNVETWIRLESGNVVGAVMLNRTYGEDEYPATPNTETRCPMCDL